MTLLRIDDVVFAAIALALQAKVPQDEVRDCCCASHPSTAALIL